MNTMSKKQNSHEIICARGFPSTLSINDATKTTAMTKENANKTAKSTKSASKSIKSANALVLGIGANIGNENQILARFWHLLCFFATHSRIFSIATSPIYRNPPFGYAHQAHFYNAIITFSTSLSLLQIYALVFYLERRFGRGRKREFKNAPRKLDIDIIFYNDSLLKREYLQMPHASYYKRPSVLVPALLCGWLYGGFCAFGSGDRFYRLKQNLRGKK